MHRAAPAERRLALPQGALAWVEWGRPGDGPSLLLLHATGFHARLWDPVIAALPADLHIVAPDLRGHGRSFDPDTLADWNAIADDLPALVDAALPAGALGVGHSMGGYCLTRLAAMRPAAFARLLLVDPVIVDPAIYRPDTPRPDAADHPVARRRDRWASTQAMIAAFAAREPYSRWVPAALDAYCRYGLVPAEDGDGLRLACPPALEASAYTGAAHNDAMASVAAVRCPVTVLRARTGKRDAGGMDFSISPTWPPLAGAFADGRDLHWADLSHFIPMEAPGRLAALILSEREAARQG